MSTEAQKLGAARGAILVSINTAVEALIQTKRTANLRPRYIYSLQKYLEQFAKGRESVPLSSITVETVEEWFAVRKETQWTQRGNLGRLGSLFGFACRRGWIDRNPMKQLEQFRVERTPAKILTVEQSQRLMDFVQKKEPHSMAYFTLVLFGGARPQEVEKVTWDNWRDDTLTIDAAASKVRRRRIIHLKENAQEWLALARERRSLLPFSSARRAHVQRKAAWVLGFEDGWCQDIARHTCSSMWLAESKDAGMVSMQLGNSPTTLLNHYYELVTDADAEAFWSIRPDWLRVLEKRWTPRLVKQASN